MAASDPLIGQRLFGGYTVSRRLDAGGMGTVYLAENEQLGRRLAVKVLHADRLSDPQAVARFVAEARAASAIRHPNIVEILDSAALPDGRHYMVMEFVAGETLRRHVRHHGALRMAEILDVLVQICSGLQAAHDRGIIHRDIKPSNIILCPRGDGRHAVTILDFGVAKLQDPNLSDGTLTQSRSIVGTPHYMSPEQARAQRDIDHRADIYSVGTMAYELLAKRLPYEADTLGELVYQHAVGPRPPKLRALCPEVPQAWSELIARAVAIAPEERPASARELALEMMAATPGGRAIVASAAPDLLADSQAVAPYAALADDRTALPMHIHNGGQPGGAPNTGSDRSTATSHRAYNQPVPGAHGRRWLKVALLMGVLFVAGALAVLMLTPSLDGEAESTQASATHPGIAPDTAQPASNDSRADGANDSPIPAAGADGERGEAEAGAEMSAAAVRAASAEQTTDTSDQATAQSASENEDKSAQKNARAKPGKSAVRNKPSKKRPRVNRKPQSKTPTGDDDDLFKHRK
ncbi:MAG: serine/threonine-protein kinase [Myxococcota bacterium]